MPNDVKSCLLLLSQTVVADTFMCPGFRRAAGITDLGIGVKCYLLNSNVDATASAFVPPFGYPMAGLLRKPLKLAELDQYGAPLNMSAVTDLDLVNAPGFPWGPGVPIPLTPSHGSVRNTLFLDWHVEATRAW